MSWPFDSQYEFLVVFHSNYGANSHRLPNKMEFSICDITMTSYSYDVMIDQLPAYDFLVVFHSNYGPNSHRLPVKMEFSICGVKMTS
jgi:hypothetical protein